MHPFLPAYHVFVDAMHEKNLEQMYNLYTQLLVITAHGLGFIGEPDQHLSPKDQIWSACQRLDSPLVEAGVWSNIYSSFFQDELFMHRKTGSELLLRPAYWDVFQTIAFPFFLLKSFCDEFGEMRERSPEKDSPLEAGTEFTFQRYKTHQSFLLSGLHDPIRRYGTVPSKDYQEGPYLLVFATLVRSKKRIQIGVQSKNCSFFVTTNYHGHILETSPCSRIFTKETPTEMLTKIEETCKRIDRATGFSSMLSTFKKIEEENKALQSTETK